MPARPASSAAAGRRGPPPGEAAARAGGGPAGGAGAERALELVDHRGRARPAVGGVLGQAAVEHAVDRARQVRVALGGQRRGILDVGARLGREVLALEGTGAGQQLEGHDGERVAVRGRGRGLPDRLLGRDVGGGAEHLPGLRELVLERHAGDPEVRDREAVAIVEQQVAGLDVAVDHAGGVRGVERAGRLAQPLQRRGVPDGGPGLDAVADRAPAHQLHDHEHAAVVLADVIDRHDVLVRGEARRGPRLALEALARPLVLGQVRGQQLDRHRAAEQLVVGLPDRGHAAVGEVAHDAIAVGQRNTGLAHRRHP
jgi:hypothetical protein